MLCMDCGLQMRLSTEPIVEKYKGVSVTVTGVEHYVCDSCGEYQLDAAAADELSKQLIEGYARQCGLLTPNQIREARKRLGMTQTEFEAALGVSTPTASRWETGVMPPSKPVCKLIQALIDKQEHVQGSGHEVDQPYEPKEESLCSTIEWKVIAGGMSDRRKPRYVGSSQEGSYSTLFDEMKEG